MAVTIVKDVGPFTAPPGETYTDAATSSDGFVNVDVILHLTGSVSQVQADYTTLTGTTAPALTSTSVVVDYNEG